MVTLDLPPFTLVGATTRTGLLTTPLRDRFGIQARLEPYTTGELVAIVKRSAGILQIPLEDGGAEAIAVQRSRGTPRVANRLLRRVRDYAEVRMAGVLSADAARAALELLEVDARGLDRLDREMGVRSACGSPAAPSASPRSRSPWARSATRSRTCTSPTCCARACCCAPRAGAPRRPPRSPTWGWSRPRDGIGARSAGPESETVGERALF